MVRLVYQWARTSRWDPWTLVIPLVQQMPCRTRGYANVETEVKVEVGETLAAMALIEQRPA